MTSALLLKSAPNWVYTQERLICLGLVNYSKNVKKPGAFKVKTESFPFQCLSSMKYLSNFVVISELKSFIQNSEGMFSVFLCE